MELIRLQKLIAQSGLYSRREAESLIAQGKVTVNNSKANLGAKASWNDVIKIDQKILKPRLEKVYYLFNKPKATLTSLKKQDDRKIILDYIKLGTHVFSVGRLDYHTTGVLLLTNDGELAYRLMHPKYEVIRKYEAKLPRDLTDLELKTLNSKQMLVDNKTSWQQVRKIKPKTYEVTLKQGLNHHVKKLFLQFNLLVLKLKRIQFANLKESNSLKPADYRPLTSQEIRDLKKIVNLK